MRISNLKNNFMSAMEEFQRDELTDSERDVLFKLVEEGPIADGDIPSKVGLSSLIDKGAATKVILAGKDGMNAATYYGGELFKKVVGSDTLEDAIQSRLAAKANNEEDSGDDDSGGSDDTQQTDENEPDDGNENPEGGNQAASGDGEPTNSSEGTETT